MRLNRCSGGFDSGLVGNRIMCPGCIDVYHALMHAMQDLAVYQLASAMDGR
jgi:hypothetical protein